MIARIIQWIRQGGRRYPQSSSPFGGTLGNNVGGLTGVSAPGQFFQGNSGVNLVFSEGSPAAMYFGGNGVAERTIRLEDHRG